MPLDTLMLVYMCHVRHGFRRVLKGPLKIVICQELPCLEKTENENGLYNIWLNQ